MSHLPEVIFFVLLLLMAVFFIYKLLMRKAKELQVAEFEKKVDNFIKNEDVKETNRQYLKRFSGKNKRYQKLNLHDK